MTLLATHSATIHPKLMLLAVGRPCPSIVSTFFVEFAATQLALVSFWAFLAGVEAGAWITKNPNSSYWLGPCARRGLKKSAFCGTPKCRGKYVGIFNGESEWFFWNLNFMNIFGVSVGSGFRASVHSIFLVLITLTINGISLVCEFYDLSFVLILIFGHLYALIEPRDNGIFLFFVF